MEATGKVSLDDAALSIVSSMQDEGYSLNDQATIIQKVRGLLRDEIDSEMTKRIKAFEEAKKEFIDLKNAI